MHAAIFGITAGIVLTSAAFGLGVMPRLKKQYIGIAKATIDAYCERECDPLEEAAYVSGIIDNHEGKARVVERWANKEYSIVKPGGIIEQVDDRGRVVDDISAWRHEFVGPPTPAAEPNDPANRR
jgi:hypothetical protein